MLFYWEINKFEPIIQRKTFPCHEFVCLMLSNYKTHGWNPCFLIQRFSSVQSNSWPSGPQIQVASSSRYATPFWVLIPDAKQIFSQSLRLPASKLLILQGLPGDRFEECFTLVNVSFGCYTFRIRSNSSKCHKRYFNKFINKLAKSNFIEIMLTKDVKKIIWITFEGFGS